MIGLGIFELSAVAVFGLSIFGVVVDDQLYRLLNTVANLATVALLVWHQRHVRKQLEPKVDESTALIRRKLGDRDPDSDSIPPDGVDRRHS